MLPIGSRLVLLPQCRLRFVAVPRVLLTCHMAVENRLVLELVAPKSPSECLFRPYNLTPHGETGRLQSILEVPLPARSVAHVEGGTRFYDSPIGGKSGRQKLSKFIWCHPVALHLQPLFRVTLVVDVIGRVGEYQIGCFPGHQPPHVRKLDRISAQHSMVVTQLPKVAEKGDRRLRDRGDCIRSEERRVGKECRSRW